MRVRQLAHDLETIAAALAIPRLIIDLRYVHGELEPALRLGRLLARRELALERPALTITPAQERPAGQTTLCLVNRGTSGPLEAVLDALQAAGDVLLVGTPSAGDTGRFTSVENAPGWRVIVGDHRRAGGSSLLDVGVTPALFVETTPDAEDAAYVAFDASQPMTELLDAPVEKARFDEARLQQRFDEIHPGNGGLLAPANGSDSSVSSNTAAPGPQAPEASPAPAPAASPAKPPTPSEGPVPFDRSLQRAVATLVADEIFRARGE